MVRKSGGTLNYKFLIPIFLSVIGAVATVIWAQTSRDNAQDINIESRSKREDCQKDHYLIIEIKSDLKRIIKLLEED